MRLDKRRLYDLVFEQKCIPWRLQPLIKRVMLAFGRGYGKDFFDSAHRKELYENAASIVFSLIKKYHPRTVADLGCGDGVYLEFFLKDGIKVIGFDNSREGIKRCKMKGINIKKFNVVKDSLIGNTKYDIAICFEVAEHLPNYASRKLVEALSKLSDLVIFTAAYPGQGGYNHINEQPPTFWIQKFNDFGFSLDQRDTNDLQKQWLKCGVVKYMIDNLLVFKH